MPEGEMKSVKKSPARLLFMVAIVYLFVPLVLMACAGDFGWWQAWVYSLVVFAAGVGGRIWSELQHPGLMAERVKFGKSDVKRWDKILSPLMSFSVGFPMVIVAGLDHRFSWTTPFALWVNLVGLLLVGLGYAVAIWAMIVNSFFSTVVRIQKERGHAVCVTGPYRIIRHPGYAGNLLALFGIVMALDSLWALIPAIAALVIVLIRTTLEDQTLQAELPGYREYTCRVRYRLFPGIY